MELSSLFFINSILFGLALSMDAFSVSLVNGISEPDMPVRKGLVIALVFAFFQALMPMLGWSVMHALVMYFSVIQKLIPYVSFLLLFYIGSGMIWQAWKKRTCAGRSSCLCGYVLLLQGISTSLDAFSVGIAISNYAMFAAACSVLIIALVTFVICTGGIFLGRRLGSYVAGRSEIFGGLVLIAIGLEILVNG